MFGRKSEKRLVLEGQPSLFGDDEIESAADGNVDPAENDGEGTACEDSQPSHKRKTTKRLRQTWENLPVLHTLTIEPKGVDPSRYRRIGEETTYQIGFEPGKLFRIAIVRPKYGLIEIRPITLGRKNYLFCGNHERPPTCASSHPCWRHAAITTSIQVFTSIESLRQCPASRMPRMRN